MSYASLSEFLEDLARERLLARIEAEVSPDLEIAEISRRQLERQGPALLFSKIQGQRLPVVTNLLASEHRICRALGVDSLAVMSQRLAEPQAAASGGGWIDALRQFPAGNGGSRLEPRLVKNAPCQQVVRLASDVDLGELPFLRCSAEDPAARAVAAVVTTQSADRSMRGAEICNLRVLERNRLALDWRPYAVTRRMWLGYQRRNQPLPLAITLGGHPLETIAALAPQPFAGDPWLLTGALRSRPLEIVRARTLDMELPAEAEIVLEGVVDTRDAGPEASSEVVVEVTAITQRANAVAVALIQSAAPHELSVLNAAVQRLFLPSLQRFIPELIDFSFPDFGGGGIAVVAMHKTYAGQARKVASLLWGLDAWADVRLLVLVDEQVDLHDLRDMARRLANADFQNDLFWSHGVLSAEGQHASGHTPGQKLGLDATRSMSGEPAPRRTGQPEMPDAIKERVDRRWKEYLPQNLPPLPG